MKISCLLLDSSWVIIFPKERFFSGEINSSHERLKSTPGYRFFDYFQLNQPLLDYLLSVKNKVQVCMFTAGHVQNLPEVKTLLTPVFENIFSTKESGTGKDDPKVYHHLAEKLQKSPQEIMFIDDSSVNVEAAKKAGLEAIVFNDNNQVINELKKLIK